jgi:hypothetical protein
MHACVHRRGAHRVGCACVHSNEYMPVSLPNLIKNINIDKCG